MEYFKLLQLSREPFSNSPDPAFFYESAQHKDCIQKLEIALRLRRGLNVVTGEVGTGKTTLCRQLIQAFAGDPGISACLLLDPDFPNPRSFLAAVVQTVTGHSPAGEDGIPVMKERLKQFLFQKGVEEDRTIVLIVDEGQKMPPNCLETLRELLNFETNEYKLFQVVIFAQNEFSSILEALPNLADRVNLYYRLGPLNFKDTRSLIRHRIRLAGGSETLGAGLFSLPALWYIFRLSGGFPRKIIHLCHQCLLTMIIQNRTKVTRRMVSACARRIFVNPREFRLMPVGIVLVLLVVLGLGAWRYSGGIQGPRAPAKNIEEAKHAEIVREEPVRTEEMVQSTAPEAVGGPIPESNSMPDTGGNAVLGTETAPNAVATPLSRGEVIPDEPPAVLGPLPVALGDTLGGLLQKVYGTYTYRYYQAVLSANPELTDPNSLKAGQTLLFPALFADMKNVPEATWWVSLSRESNLKAAVAKLRDEAFEDLPIRILAVQSAGEVLSFRIVLKTCFENKDVAERAKEQLDLSIPATSEVFCLIKTEAIVYGSIN